MPAGDLTARQLELIATLAALEPPPWFMGGYAEDALLAGAVTREHEDVDLIFPRAEEELRLRPARRARVRRLGDLGRGRTRRAVLPVRPERRAQARPGDRRPGGRRATGCASTGWRSPSAGEEAPAGYQLRLPDDLFDHPVVELEGIALKPISPLALYQMRAGVAKRNSFGPLSERQRATMAELRARFFPEVPEDDLLPPSEPL